MIKTACFVLGAMAACFAVGFYAGFLVGAGIWQ